MKSTTYLVVAVLAFAAFASAGGKKNFVPGGTILDIVGPNGPNKRATGPRRVRDLFNRRAVANNQ